MLLTFADLPYLEKGHRTSHSHSHSQQAVMA